MTSTEVSAAEGSVRAEIRQFLSEDETRLGDVFRAREEGLAPAAVAERLGVPSVGFAYSYGQLLDVLVEGALPTDSARPSRQTLTPITQLAGAARSCEATSVLGV